MSWKKIAISLLLVVALACLTVFAINKTVSNHQHQPHRFSVATNTRTKQANKLLPLDKVLPDLERLLKSPAGKETKAEPPPDLQRSVEWLIWKSRVISQSEMFEKNNAKLIMQDGQQK